MPKAVRLADIAQKAGVSTVTVSKALAGQKGVSEAVRMRIRQLADEMGYVPPKTKIREGLGEDGWKIGVLIAENYLGSHVTYYWKLYQELALAATEKQCFTTVETLNLEEKIHTLELPQIVLQKNVDGLVVIGEIDKEYIRKLRAYVSVPIVFLDFYDRELAQDAVIVDNFYGMYLMTELLFAHGFEEIGFIGSIYATSSIMDRYCGYMKAMTQHRVNIRPEWVLEDRDETGLVGFELPMKLPKAFVCNCDLAAGMLIEKLAKRGLRVPEDISVAGFDNFLYPGHADLKITTYEVNTKALVKVTVKKLLKRLRSPNAGQGLEIVSGHIVMKSSVRQAAVSQNKII